MTQVAHLAHDGVCVSPSAVDNSIKYASTLSQCLNDSGVNHRRQSRMTTTVTQQDQAVPRDESAVDHKLVTRVQQGDTTAFDMLVLKYQGRVASIVSRYVSDKHEIADVTQEAFIKAFRALGNFRADSAFYTWLYRIAVNCAKNYLTSKSRKTPVVDVDINDAEHTHTGAGLRDIDNPADQLNRDQLETIVYETIRSLPEDLRMALTLREFEGLSYDEISKVMECPVGTVRSRIFRAREAVDQALQTAQGGTP